MAGFKDGLIRMAHAIKSRKSGGDRLKIEFWPEPPPLDVLIQMVNLQLDDARESLCERGKNDSCSNNRRAIVGIGPA